MAITTFRLPTVAREMDQAGGSGSWTNVNNALLVDSSLAVCSLPDGTTYTPTSTETDAGQVLPAAIFLNHFQFDTELPANATVTGIAIKTILYSEYSEGELSVNYNLQFANFPDAVPYMQEDYFLFQQKNILVAKSATSIKTIGGAGDVWQPAKSLLKDGMYMYVTDAVTPGYEVITSTLDSYVSDFNFNGHDMIIQPTTQGYANSSLDLSDAFSTFNFASFVAGGGTVTVSFPGFFPSTTFVAQLGFATPGDATFQCVLDNDQSLQNLSNQINFHADTSAYITSNIFTGAGIWELASVDVGSYTNGVSISSNLPAAFLGGQFAGGADPDPNVSVMLSGDGATGINSSGAPIHAHVDGSNGTILQITNAMTFFSLQTSVSASVFRDPLFGMVLYCGPTTDSTGDPLVYPEIPDNTQKLNYVQVQLTYTVPIGSPYPVDFWWLDYWWLEQ